LKDISILPYTNFLCSSFVHLPAVLPINCAYVIFFYFSEISFYFFYSRASYDTGVCDSLDKSCVMSETLLLLLFWTSAISFVIFAEAFFFAASLSVALKLVLKIKDSLKVLFLFTIGDPTEPPYT